MYSSKDISIIIVSYNRPQELERNFLYLEKMYSKPYEVMVIDQSEKPDTKKVCQKYSKKIKNLRYLRSEKPSIAIAKNVGVRNASKKTKILLFLDDDAYGGPSYMDEIVSAYNRHKNIIGVYGEEERFKPEFIKKQGRDIFKDFKFKSERAIKRFFLLGYRGDKTYRVISPYGNTFVSEIKEDMPAQWFGGSNPSFKKSVFKDMKFDENFFGWSLGEDLDISYRIYKKYGGLYIVPSTLFHTAPLREDTHERKIRRIYMNQINHFYIFYKDMPEMKLKFFWNYVGIFTLRLFMMLNVFQLKKNFNEFKYLVKSFIYSIKNLEKIKKGDLSLPV